MLDSDTMWNVRNLRRWLLDPQRIVPGSKCGLEPIEEDSVAYDLCQYLKEFTLLNYNYLRNMKTKLPIAEQYDFSRQTRETYLK